MARKKITKSGTAPTTKLLGELKSLRHRYSELLHRLRGEFGDDEDVEFDYRRLYQEWEEGEPEPQALDSENTWLIIDFRETLSPIWGLIVRVEHRLIARSFRSKQDRRSLEEFRRMPFVKNLEGCVRNQPFLTLSGIEAVIALLQHVERDRKPASKQAQTKELPQKGEEEKRGDSLPATPSPQPIHPQKEYKTALGRNIDKLRIDCGWSFDDLAQATELDKKLILGHVNKGKGVHPRTLATYANAFNEKLGLQMKPTDLKKDENH